MVTRYFLNFLENRPWIGVMEDNFCTSHIFLNVSCNTLRIKVSSPALSVFLCYFCDLNTILVEQIWPFSMTPILSKTAEAPFGSASTRISVVERYPYYKYLKNITVNPLCYVKGDQHQFLRNNYQYIVKRKGDNNWLNDYQRNMLWSFIKLSAQLIPYENEWRPVCRILCGFYGP